MKAIDPASLSPEQLASILKKSGAKVTVAEILDDLAAGAPQNADGTIHLIHYAAWLASQVS